MGYYGKTVPAAGESTRIRVLHVDDDVDFVDLAAEWLERENDAVEVVTETTVDDGLDRLADASIDCIVSDFEMPGQDGLEFLERVRADHGDVPFILFTGKGSEEIASEAISAGVSDYLQKERGTDQYTVLAHRIENAVEQYRSRRAVEATEEKLTQLAERTDDVLFMFDDEWEDLLFVNSAYEDMWGGSMEELEEDPYAFLQHVHPDDRETARRAVEGLRRGEGASIEYRVIVDGETRWVTSEAKPIFDDDGEVVRIAGSVRDVTELTERVQELQARATALEAASDGIAILNEDREYVLMNEAHAEIYGFDDPDELVGRGWRACYDSADAARFESEILPRVSSAGRWEGEMTVTTADGRTIDQHLVLKRVSDGRTVCAVREITGRKERERKLAGLNAVAGDVTASDSVTEVCERTIEASQDLLEFDLCAIDIEEDGFLEKRAISESTPPEDITAMPIEEGIAGLTYRTGESLVIDDIETWDEANPEGPYRSALSVPIGDHGVYQAVAEEPNGFDDSDLELAELLVSHATQGLDRLESERRRERERDRLTTAFEAIAEPVVHVVFDEGRPIVRNANRAFEEVFGHELSEIEGRPLNDLIVPEDGREEARRIDEETVDSRVVERQVERLAADGRREFLFRAGILDSEQATHEGIGIYVDITDRRERERAIERQNERLEEFASVVSHDLQNPLSVADGRVELAREDCDGDHLDVAAEALDRMATLIDDILTVAREGEAVDETEPVELPETIESCWRTVENPDATLVVDSERTIAADRARLKRLLENLFCNAVEHGGRDVTVTVGDLADGFYVADDGTGIAADEREQVFETGYSNSETGAGFGLSIVREIAEAHGWDVRATDAADGGARFEITGVDLADDGR